ncbi:hypothetical protein [Thiohalophilus sp.]|uniref:hypothetical protein n=1 Tax=Thiohalophilus sp. TaxID=3028392 RepID=UPI003975C453
MPGQAIRRNDKRWHDLICHAGLDPASSLCSGLDSCPGLELAGAGFHRNDGRGGCAQK